MTANQNETPVQHWNVLEVPEPIQPATPPASSEPGKDE